ncbi:MAG TPA: SRPBCC family protein [Candidatus Thermoplasmatota archaeon]|nr:SRPBCC family protein [Candidatus Thermoplasmatota archaeon]
MTWPARHVSVGIRRAPRDVYAFAADPRNLPRWASGLASGVRPEGDAWIADSPMGAVAVRFGAANDLGVLDHDVTLPDGTVVHNPLRVLASGEGSEVVFTLYRRDGMSAEELERDARIVAQDLAALRRLLEER